MNDRAVVLVIDDDPVVRKLLSSIMNQEGHEIIETSRAETGLSLAQDRHPDLILLDVMMPEMDGFEAIRRLRSDPVTADTPIIFLSAKVQTADRVKGLELGASDYLSKPVDRAELIARIRTHLKLKRQGETLREYTHNLEKMVEDRTRRLIHADRLASLGTLAAGIAHEINNPTTFITGNLQTLENFWKKIVPFLENHPQAKEDGNINYIIKEFPAMIKSIRSGANRITNIVAGLKAFARKDSSLKSHIDVNECIEEALKLTYNHIKYYVTIEKNLDPALPFIWAAPQQLIQVFVNLMLNAADAIGEKEGRLKITSRQRTDRWVEIIFEDTGQGMSPEIKDKIFDPFFTTKTIGEGTGLGLSITHGIIKDHQGTIEVESTPGKGATFVMTLPTEKN